MRGRLELRQSETTGKPRHHLNRRLLVPGDVVEVLLEDMTWLRGRYDWSLDPADPPRLRVMLTGAGQPEIVAPLPPEAILRWPHEEGEARRGSQDDRAGVCGSGPAEPARKR